ncbi:MAG: hypothetical protein ACRCTJ_07085 [Brevinema sp.]
MGNNVYIVNKIDSIMGLKRLIKIKKYPFKVFLNGKEIKDNETIKEGDTIVNIDKVEGEVYKFQSDISWFGVDSTLKINIIQAMCELYCDYKMRGKSWTILEISSAYRNAKNQARVMIDTYIDQGRRKMSEIYASRWDNAVDLISNLYYDGNHLSCKGINIEGIPHPCEHGSISSCKATEQKSLLNRLPSNEQSVFTGNIDLKNNKDEAKNILEVWINISNVLSNHTERKAVDFSKNNYSQHSDFDKILRKDYRLKANEPYPAGNFHVEPI